MNYTNEAIYKRKVREYRFYKFMSIIVYVLLFPLIIYNVSLIAQSVFKPGVTPNVFGIKTYVIISGSMEPEYNIGDIVIAQKTSAEEFLVGDVISFREGESVVTHRISGEIVENGVRKFKTKGDNNNTEDYWNVDIKSIEGEVIGCIPGLGKVTLMLQNKVTILLVILAFYAYILRNHKIKLRNETRKYKREQFEQRQERLQKFAYNQ